MKVKIQDLLQQAIEEQDWNIIAKLYYSITQTPIEIPKKPKHKNLFRDDGKLVKRDSDAIKKLYNPPNLENRRQPIQYIDIKCKGCGRTESVPAEIAIKYNGDPEKGSPEYKCQNCIKILKSER